MHQCQLKHSLTWLKLRQFEMSVHGVHAEQIPEMMSLRYSLYLYSVGQKKKTFRVKRKDASHFPCHSLHPHHPPITAYLYVYNLPPPLLSSRLLASPPPITSSSHDSQTHPFPLRSLLTGRFSLQSESLV